MAPGMSEEGVRRRRSVAAGCGGQQLLGRAAVEPRRFCWGSVWRQRRCPASGPSGESWRVTRPAALSLATQDLWFRPCGSLLPPVGQVSVTRAMSPARSPWEGPHPGRLAHWPRALGTPPQPIHLGPHGGHFLSQACQRRGEAIQLLCEGSTEAVQLLLQGLPTVARRLRGGGWQYERRGFLRGQLRRWRLTGWLRRDLGEQPPMDLGCNSGSSMSKLQASGCFTNPGPFLQPRNRAGIPSCTCTKAAAVSGLCSPGVFTRAAATASSRGPTRTWRQRDRRLTAGKAVPLLMSQTKLASEW